MKDNIIKVAFNEDQHHFIKQQFFVQFEELINKTVCELLKQYDVNIKHDDKNIVNKLNSQGLYKYFEVFEVSQPEDVKDGVVKKAYIWDKKKDNLFNVCLMINDGIHINLSTLNDESLDKLKQDKNLVAWLKELVNNDK